jgi:hypothetical protein
MSEFIVEGILVISGVNWLYSPFLNGRDNLCATKVKK